MDHLTENTRNFMKVADDSQRFSRIEESKWIGYSRATSIGIDLDALVAYPKSARMPNILLVGESNNGKTMILNRFCQRHPAFLDSDQRPICPVVMVQAPPEPDELRLYGNILSKIDANIRATERVEKRQERVIAYFRDLQVKVLVIDEIQHVLAGSTHRQRQFLNVIKYLSNELQIPIVCAGTPEAFNAIQTDAQLANRFEPKLLKRWSNDEEYMRLLASFEATLPLRERSILTERQISSRILAMSDGLIGEIKKILEKSAKSAIMKGKEKISIEIVDNIEYIQPADRNRPFLL